MKRSILLSLLMVASGLSGCSAWITNGIFPSCRESSTAASTTASIRTKRTALSATASRRYFTSTTSAAIFGALLTTSTAAASAAEGNVFSDKNFSTGDAKERLSAARKDLKYLVENYADISKQGGDKVRSILGTQGVSSSLYGIQKVLKLLREEADDIVEYTEAMDEFNAYYYQAEGAAYQSMFVEHSSAKGTPESFLKTAKADIIN
ncbi:MAG: hypothetical protein SGARI_006787, partial [Bacillariaceae sp.]